MKINRSTEYLFTPPWWLSNPHLQTLWPTLFRRPIKDLILTRERVELADGDFVDLDWTGGPKNSPVVLVLYGVEGSTRSAYVKNMLYAIQQQGWRGVLLHFRGCSGELNRFLHSYHAGKTNDLAAVTQMLQAREPNTPLAAVGFSLGGNVLLKWLGETGEKNPLVSAVAISVPFDLEKSVRRLNNGFSRLYQAYLLACLRRKISTKLRRRTWDIQLPQLNTLRTLYDFDNQITAKLHGFTNAEDYYAQSSCRQYLQSIRVPTLLLQAKDDPFMTEDALPQLHDISEQVQFELSEKGGHVGFITGNAPWALEYWLDKRVPMQLATGFLRH
jgi:predicted alpha/beta-fold hydrolase